MEKFCFLNHSNLFGWASQLQDNKFVKYLQLDEDHLIINLDFYSFWRGPWLPPEEPSTRLKWKYL